MKRIKRPVMNSGSIVKADEEEVLPCKREISRWLGIGDKGGCTFD